MLQNQSLTMCLRIQQMAKKKTSQETKPQKKRKIIFNGRWTEVCRATYFPFDCFALSLQRCLTVLVTLNQKLYILVPRGPLLLVSTKSHSHCEGPVVGTCAELSFRILSQSDLVELLLGMRRMTGSEVADFWCCTFPEVGIFSAD